MADDHNRNIGSSIVAFVFGAVLLLFGIYLQRVDHFDWTHYRKPIEFGSCYVFGGVLIIWALTKKWSQYVPGSVFRIGFETVTMIVAVVTAVIAILTLTDAATSHKTDSPLPTPTVSSDKH